MADQHKIIFAEGGMNFDDSDATMPQNDNRGVWNARYGVTDSGNDGMVENEPGNVKVNNPDLPQGTNKTIGKCEDEKDNTIFYFNYNSLGFHGIYRYYPNKGTTGEIQLIKKSSLFDFQLDKLITGVNYIDGLLNWTDYNKQPRKINVDKANITGKKLKNNVYFFTDMLCQWTGLTVDVVNGVTTTTVSLTRLVQPSGTGTCTETLVDTAEEFVKLWNANSVLSAFATASSCSGHATLTTNTAEQVLNISITAQTLTGPVSLYVVADNYYPDPFREEYLSAIKYQFECQPDVVAKLDEEVKSNLIVNRPPFQFRCKYIYDDNDRSVWGPISVVPSYPVSCSQSTSAAPFNYLEIDFDTERLNDAGSLSVIKRVEIAVREGNDGAWRFVRSLEREEFISSRNTFKFFNDGYYPAISEKELEDTYDSVPLLAKSQELVEDHLLYGGIVEGYDGICVDASLKVDYEKEPVLSTFSISGKIFIRNKFAQHISYRMHQPIHTLTGNVADAVFGGFGNNDVVNTVGSSYGQNIPLGGFVPYLAGTSFYTVSVQRTGNNPGIQTNGVYDSSTSGNRSKVRDEITGSSGGGSGEVPDTRVWSDFTISGVPPGKYALRIAGHTLTSADIGTSSLEWQKTSTYTKSVAGQQGFEAVLEVKSNGDVVIGNVTYPGGQLPATEIEDQTDPELLSQSTVLSGYVTDMDIPSPQPADLINDTRIELARVITTIGNVKTDHNGFFYHSFNYPVGSSPTMLDVLTVQSGNYNFVPNKYDMAGGAWSAPSGDEMKQGIFRNTNSTIQSSSRTIIQGSISYNGRPLAAATVVNTRGAVDTTDSNGDYSFYAYADTYASSRVDEVLYGLSDTCIATFDHNSTPYNIAIDANNYNSTTNSVNSLLDVIALTIIGGSSTESLKRGGKYRFGIVYYDEAGRHCFVQASEALELLIPFYTQKDSSGTIIGKGRAIVEWLIRHTAPSWATRYQWVRTKNGKQGRYIQWTAKTIRYVDRDGNTSSFQNAVEVVIDMEGILDYANQHVDSKVGYAFEDGDMLVFKKDHNGNFFNDYYEFKVKGGKQGASLGLYIDNLVSMGQIYPGCQFEIYNPKKDTQNDFFYEIGECFEIGTDQNGKRYHKGLTQDQKFWDFADNYFASGFVGFNSTQQHNLVVGDKIFIEQAAGYLHQSYEGEATVTAVPSSTQIVTDKSWAGSSPINPGKITAAAIGTFRTGDTWNRVRTIPYNNTAGAIIGTPSNAVKTIAVEDQSISDFYVSKAESIGRAHIVNKDGGRIQRPSVIRFSKIYVPGTKVNGLATFRGLDEISLPTAHGLINKLLLSKNVLLSFHENSETNSMYINRALLNDLSGQQIVATTEQFISRTYEYSGSYGTQNPESVTMDDDGEVCSLDRKKGAWVKRSSNGNTVISHIKFDSKAKEICNKLNKLSSPQVPAIYDRTAGQFKWTIPDIICSKDVLGESTGETVETSSGVEVATEIESALRTGSTTVIPTNNDCKDESGYTVAFNKYMPPNGRWEDFFNMVPEFWAKGRNEELVSFKDGELWLHYRNSLYSNYYGMQYGIKLTGVANLSPSMMKRWMYLSLERTRNKNWSAPIITTPVSSEYPNGQESDLVESDFVLEERVLRADILKDKNTPNVSNPVINGDDMLGETMTVTIENQATDFSTIYAMNVYSIISNSTDK